MITIIRLIFLIIVTLNFSSIFCQNAESKFKIGVDFSNNLCFMENDNYDYKPGYGYDFGLNVGFRLQKRTFIHTGLNIMRYSYNYNSEYSFPFLDNIEGIPPYNVSKRIDNFYIRVPLIFKTDLLKNFYLNYGAYLTCYYKFNFNYEVVSSDNIKTVEKTTNNIPFNLNLINNTCGLEIGAGYRLNIKDNIILYLEPDFKIPLLLKQIQDSELPFAYTFGLKIGLDMIIK